MTRVKPRSRTLKRDTLKALERAAMRWSLYFDMRWANDVDSDLVEKEFSKAEYALTRACAAHAQSQGWGKEGKEMSDLLPCPFCGGSADFRGELIHKFQIECVNCSVRGASYVYSHAAVEAWNRRSSLESVRSEALKKEVERLRDALEDAADALYNQFAPDSQSRAYQAALEALQSSEAVHSTELRK